MRDRFVNIGNRAFVNVSKVTYVVAADADKVRRILSKHNIDKDSEQVQNFTSKKETRSILYLDEGRIALSSVNATVLVKRINAEPSQADDEE